MARMTLAEAQTPLLGASGVALNTRLDAVTLTVRTRPRSLDGANSFACGDEVAVRAALGRAAMTLREVCNKVRADGSRTAEMEEEETKRKAEMEEEEMKRKAVEEKEEMKRKASKEEEERRRRRAMRAEEQRRRRILREEEESRRRTLKRQEDRRRKAAEEEKEAARRQAEVRRILGDVRARRKRRISSSALSRAKGDDEALPSWDHFSLRTKWKSRTMVMDKMRC